MTPYQRGDVVLANGVVWLWIQPPGMAGEFVNSYGQMITAEGIAMYEPQLLVRDGQLVYTLQEGTS